MEGFAQASSSEDALSNEEWVQSKDATWLLSPAKRAELCVSLLSAEDNPSLQWSCDQLSLLLVDENLMPEAFSSLLSMLHRSGGIERLCTLLLHGTAAIHCSALHILGNLVALDGSATGETKQLIRQAGGIHAMLDHMHSEDAMTVSYAVGCIMNCCTTPEDVRVFHAGRHHLPRIVALSQSADPNVAHFAKGCMLNMQVALGHAQIQRAMEAQVQSSASVALQAAARGYLIRRKRAESDEQSTLPAVSAEFPTGTQGLLSEDALGSSKPTAWVRRHLRQEAAARLRAQLAVEAEYTTARALSVAVAKDERSGNGKIPEGNSNKMQDRAATSLQAAARGRLLRSSQQKQVVMVMRIQLAIRRWQMKLQKERYQEQKYASERLNAASRIQAAVRGWQIKSAERVQIASHSSKLVTLGSLSETLPYQCHAPVPTPWWRRGGRDLQVKASSLLPTTTNPVYSAPPKLQTQVSSGTVRSRSGTADASSQPSAWATVELSASRVQSWRRSVLAQRQALRRIDALTKLQAGARGLSVRKEIATHHAAATTVQAVTRAHKGRSEATRRNAAVATIQSGGRTLVVRAAQRKAALKVQCGVRGWRGRKLASTRSLASTTLTAGARGWSSRRQASQRTQAGMTLTAGARGHIARKEAELRLAAARALGTGARRHLTFKAKSSRDAQAILMMSLEVGNNQSCAEPKTTSATLAPTEYRALGSVAASTRTTSPVPTGDAQMAELSEAQQLAPTRPASPIVAAEELKQALRERDEWRAKFEEMEAALGSRRSLPSSLHLTPSSDSAASQSSQPTPASKSDELLSGSPIDTGGTHGGNKRWALAAFTPPAEPLPVAPLNSKRDSPRLKYTATRLATPPIEAPDHTSAAISHAFIGQLLSAPTCLDRPANNRSYSSQRTSSSLWLDRRTAPTERSATAAKAAYMIRTNSSKPLLRSTYASYRSAPRKLPARPATASWFIPNSASLPLWRQRLFQDLAELPRPRGAGGLLTGDVTHIPARSM